MEEWIHMEEAWKDDDCDMDIDTQMMIDEDEYGVSGDGGHNCHNLQNMDI